MSYCKFSPCVCNPSNAPRAPIYMLESSEVLEGSDLWLKEHLFEQLIRMIFLCLYNTHTAGRGWNSKGVEELNFITSLFLIQLPWGSSGSKEMPTGNSQWTDCSSTRHSLPGKLKDRGREQAGEVGLFASTFMYFELSNFRLLRRFCNLL